MKLDFGTNITNEEKSDSNLSLIKFDPLSLNRTYGVILTISEGKNNTTKIHYEIEVTCEEELSNRTYLFVLNKKQVFINEKPASTTNEEFAEQCGKVLFPLNIIVSKNGICKEIYNHNEIKNRWNLLEKKLKQTYKHQEYINQINQRKRLFENKQQLNKIVLEKDWFIQLFFSGILAPNEKKIKEFPLYVQGKVPFRLSSIYKQHSKNKNKQIMHLKGVCVDKRSEYDILKGNPPTAIEANEASGVLDIKYQLNKQGHIDSIVGNSAIEFISNKKREVAFEIYNLKSKIPVTKFEKIKLNQIEKDKEETEITKQEKKKVYSVFGKKFMLGNK